MPETFLWQRADMVLRIYLDDNMLLELETQHIVLVMVRML